MTNSELLDILEEWVQGMRADNETDLRSVLYKIYELRKEVENE